MKSKRPLCMFFLTCKPKYGAIPGAAIEAMQCMKKAAQPCFDHDSMVK